MFEPTKEEMMEQKAAHEARKMKRLVIDGKVYTFDVVQDMYDGCLYAKCRENGKYAFLDDCGGVQFEGEHRVLADSYNPNKSISFVPRGCHYWGGQIRNNATWRARW